MDCGECGGCGEKGPRAKVTASGQGTGDRGETIRVGGPILGAAGRLPPCLPLEVEKHMWRRIGRNGRVVGSMMLAWRLGARLQQVDCEAESGRLKAVVGSHWYGLTDGEIRVYDVLVKIRMVGGHEGLSRGGGKLICESAS